MRTIGMCLLAGCVSFVFAQTQEADRTVSTPIYRVTVVQRAIQAINYGHRTLPTKIDFKGTVLLPLGHGEATVESKRAAVVVDAKFDHLEAPTRFGREYLTYVLWAITPEGRAVNIAEVVPDPDNKAHLKVTTQMQAFGLLVTAEPYFSVTQPSNVVVLENALRKDTVGKIEEVEAKYELLPRGQYTMNVQAADLQSPPPTSGERLPMDQYEAVLAVYQAQNAVQIARAAQADQYAASTLQKAEQLLNEARTLQTQKSDSKRVVMLAREAAQSAEDARMIAFKRNQQEQQALRSEQK